MSGTYRDILRWGDPKEQASLEPAQIRALERMLGVNLKPGEPYLPGDSPAALPPGPGLAPEFSRALAGIVGPDNLDTDDFSRASHACGKFYGELMALRLGRVPHPPQAVAYPKDEQQARAVVELCQKHGVALVPFGGHSSVTMGLAAPRGGVSLDLTRHMNQVLGFSAVNSSVTVQPGIYGPALEEYLNAQGCTCGHFPQSFEFSTVGGWVATRGAGQVSTAYGKIEDMVLGLKMITPAGDIATRDYPAQSLGPDITAMLVGSEGCFGVISEITLKVGRLAQSTMLASFMFKEFQPALAAMREIMQGRFGAPAMLRLSDPEESLAAFVMSGKQGSIADRVLSAMGYKPGQRSMMFVTTEGAPTYARQVMEQVKRVARANGGRYLGAGPTRHWLAQRFSSAYLREPMMDLGLMTDTLETAVTWEKLYGLWQAVRDYIKARPHTICMVHLSHVYQNGANLYFTFVSPMKKGEEMDDFHRFQQGLIQTIHDNGGSLSHHHGIGRMLGPWMESEVGAVGMGALGALKHYFDPQGIMNPGGTLGLNNDGEGGGGKEGG